MFKIGCSVAKKILPIGGNRNSNASNNAAQQLQQQPSSQENNSNDDINDFSKIKQDPRMPLNVRQMFKITKSWKAIARTMSKTGTAMFINLFEQNEDLFILFERFKHLRGASNLHESVELREHAATVMSTLDQSINSMSDFDNFVAHLHSIGKLHEKVVGFKREYFWRIEQPFLKAVKQTLDERCNETIEQIYQVAIKLIIATIADGYTPPEDRNYDDAGNNEHCDATKLQQTHTSSTSSSTCQSTQRRPPQCPVPKSCSKLNTKT